MRFGKVSGVIWSVHKAEIMATGIVFYHLGYPVLSSPGLHALENEKKKDSHALSACLPYCDHFFGMVNR